MSAAIIVDGDRILATERGYGDFKDLWEFPGGKREEGESGEETIVREIREEDIPKLSHYADKEANPLYPVPVLMNAHELEKFYYMLMPKKASHRARPDYRAYARKKGTAPEAKTETADKQADIPVTAGQSLSGKVEKSHE